ncbi:TolC family protein [Sulfurimonas sp. SAG-AH-194-L11]|nr:TolC family protein [Sulfurimonas sp. SAG-AH-194-L11]
MLKCLSLTLLALSLDAKDIYTVDQLLLKSLQNSPDLQVSKLQYSAAQSRYDTVFADYLPSLNLNVSAGRVAQDSTFNIDGVEDNVLIGKLSLKQVVYDFGKIGASSDTQKFRAQSYKMQNFQNLSNKQERVKSAYYNLLKSIALIDVQKENVKLNEAQLYRSQRYFEAGIRTKIDISDAKVKLIQAKLDLKKVEYDLKLTYSNLDKVVGFSAIENDYEVYSSKLELDKLYESLTPYPLTLHDAILFAYENRFDLKKEQALIHASKSDISSVSAEYYPELYVSANYTYQEAQSAELQVYLPKTQWNTMLNLDWNLYQGGATNSRKQEKSINASISSSQLLDTKLVIKSSVTDAYINVHRSKDTIELAQSLVLVSDEKFDQASKRYEHGLSDYIEIQEARQDYINAKATLVVDYYDYYIAIAKLDNAIGK